MKYLIFAMLFFVGCSQVNQVAEYSREHKVSCQMTKFTNCSGGAWINGNYKYSECNNIYICSDGKEFNLRY